jgi:hypothetical protein
LVAWVRRWTLGALVRFARGYWMDTTEMTENSFSEMDTAETMHATEMEMMDTTEMTESSCLEMG